MSIEKLSNPAAKSTLGSKLAATLLVIASTMIGILLFEATCWLFLPPAKDINIYHILLDRVFFFDGRGSIFEDHGPIFTYLPHNDVTNLTVFTLNHGYTVEYHYQYHTNNLGLVQDSDVVPGRDSLLLLGDSFMEGLGAEPWFRLISPQIAKLGYQPINGGLLGTGFASWLKLDRYLEGKNVGIRKVVVVFISDDYHRRVVNFTPSMLQCLRATALCDVHRDSYFRLPPQQELASWIAKIGSARQQMTKKSWLVEHVEAALPASYRIFRVLKLWALDSLSQAPQQSRAAIAALIKLHGPNNVIFIHLPQKDETTGPDRLGLLARRSIAEAGGRLFDGFKLCGMTPADYYSHDDHPTKDGYAKIAACVGSIIKQVEF